MAEKDFYKEWLGIPEELRPPTHYELLGLAEFETDRQKIDQATRDRMRIVRKYQVGKYADECVRMLMELSVARAELLNAATKASYDSTVGGGVVVVPEREELLAGQVEVFKQIVEMAVFRGAIGREHTGVLKAQAQRLQVSEAAANHIISGTFRRLERARLRRKWVTVVGISAVVLVVLGLAQLLREDGAKSYVMRAERLAQREEYREAIKELGKMPLLTFAAARAGGDRRKYEELARAEDLYGDALEYQAKHSEDYPGIIKCYGQVIDRFPQSGYARKSQQRISAVEKQMEVAAEKEALKVKELLERGKVEGARQRLAQAQDLFVRGIFGAAEYFCKKVIEEGPDSAEAKEAEDLLKKIAAAKEPPRADKPVAPSKPIEAPKEPPQQEKPVLPIQINELCTVSSIIPYAHPREIRLERIAWSPDGKTILFDICAASPKSAYGGDTLFSFELGKGSISPWFVQKWRGPAYSPDGSKVAIWLDGCGMSIVDLATRERRECTSRWGDWPTFTRDGKRICYRTGKSGRSEIWVINLDGSGERQLTDTEWDEILPAVSPVDEVVAYCSEKTWGIWVQRIDGDRAVILKTGAGGCPRWSPDGRIISFAHAGNIWLMDGMGEKKLMLTNESGGQRGHHAWSPDGTRMIYYVEHGEQGEFKIITLNLELIRQRLGLAGEGKEVSAAVAPPAGDIKDTELVLPQEKVEELRKRLQPENQALADKLLLYDSFDDYRHGWPRTVRGDRTRYVKDGTYHVVDASKESYITALLPQVFTDFVFQVTVSCEGAENGAGEVRFRKNPDSSYGLAIRFGGECDFWHWLFKENVRGQYAQLSPDIARFGAGGKNVLEGRCVGNRIKGWFNGAPTPEVLGHSVAPGSFELVCTAREKITAMFDDLVVFSVKKGVLRPYVSSLPEPVAPELRKVMGVPLCVKRWDHSGDRILTEGDADTSERAIRGGQFAYRCTHSGGAMDHHTGNLRDHMVLIKATCLEHPQEGNWGYGILVRSPLRPKEKEYEGKGYQLAITESGPQLVFFPPQGGPITLTKEGAGKKTRLKKDQNTLEALCRGEDLKFYVNGSFVGSAKVDDPNFLSGCVRTWVWGKGLKVAFDDLVVYSIKPP